LKYITLLYIKCISTYIQNIYPRPLTILFAIKHAATYRGADKSLARPAMKQAIVSVRMTRIFFGALLCRKNLDESSRLDVVEIALP